MTDPQKKSLLKFYEDRRDILAVRAIDENINKKRRVLYSYFRNGKIPNEDLKKLEQHLKNRFTKEHESIFK